MSVLVAHVFDSSPGAGAWLGLASAVGVVVLVLEHHVVAGFDRAELIRRCRRCLAVVLVMGLSAAISPAGSAQSDTALLPDLISDPPNPSFFKELIEQDGTRRLVVTFDGYVHNIGEGALDVVGNPQLDNGMKQRVADNGDWREVGAPTVKFETDDGHNHFHLMEVIEYVLWNETQGAQSAIGSKVGFCLVDSEQMEPGPDQAYSEELDNFCQENNPGATSLRMGISPGWRDIYDATTTLQWVDVSTVAPGRYWLGAITDPNDEVLESDETNNGLIFADRTISVPGFAPWHRPTITVDSEMVELRLGSTAFGNVGQPVFVVEHGPDHGSLNVPVGAALDSPWIQYFPDAGFEGTDQFVFSVRDAASPYPVEASTATVSLEVTGGGGASPTAGSAPVLVSPSTFFETTAGDYSDVSFDVSGGDGSTRLFARGLPGGLVTDSVSGSISGVAFEEGIFDVELIVMGTDPSQVVSQNVTWIVNPDDSLGGLSDMVGRSSAIGQQSRLAVGTTGLGLVFEAEGLPPGMELEETGPFLSGTPTEAGEFEVTVSQLDDGEVVATTSFTWTIRPALFVAFPL